MSSVGRIFVVLNLLLAGAFVGFAGTYLQKATDWKQAHDELDERTKQELAARDDQLRALAEERGKLDRQLAQATTNLANERSQNEGLRAEKLRLEERLAKLEADQAELTAHTATISAAIDRATQDASEARAAQIAAQKERDDALRAQVVAEGDLKDAQNQIAALESSIQENQTQLAALDAQNREKEMLLSIVNQKAPGLLQGAQPDLEGNVTHVGLDGELLTVAVNASEYEPKPGYQFAIFDPTTNDYKGEALITSVDGNNAFCRVIQRREGSTAIKVGDRADTQTY